MITKKSKSKVKPFKPLGVKVRSKNKSFEYLKVAQPVREGRK